MIGLKITDCVLRDEIRNGLYEKGYISVIGCSEKLDLNVIDFGVKDDLASLRVLLLTDGDRQNKADGFCYSMNKSCGAEAIIGRIELLAEKDVDYYEDISKLLLDVGISPLMKGYKFLKEAVNIHINHSDYKLKDIYDIIGLNNGAARSSVERNIRYCIEAAFNKGRTESYERIFKNSVSPFKGKPTNMEVICLVAHIIKIHI